MKLRGRYLRFLRRPATGVLAQFPGGIVAALLLLGLFGCTKHAVGRRHVAIFGLVTAPGGRVRSAGWFLVVHPRGAFSLPMAMTNRLGAFALNVVLSPGRYIFSLRTGTSVYRSPVVIKHQSAWYQVVKLKSDAGRGPASGAGGRAIAGVVIFGLVTKADGSTPLAHVVVGAVRSSRSTLLPPFETMATSNRLGTFVLGKRLHPGTYVVTATKGLLAARTVPSSMGTVAQTTVVIKPSSRQWVVIRLRAASGSISGRVLDGSGRPVADAGLSFIGSGNHATYAVRTDSKGRYLVTNIIAGTYIVKVGMAVRMVSVGRGRVRKNFTISSSP